MSDFIENSTVFEETDAVGDAQDVGPLFTAIMAPMFGEPNYFWSNEDLTDERNSGSQEYNDDLVERDGVREMAFWYMIMLVLIFLIWLLVFFCLRIIALSIYSLPSLFLLMFYQKWAHLLCF